MFSLCFEITNVCSKHCLHCLRDKLEPPASISLSLMEKVLAQARELKIREVSLTGGEVTLHPQFQELDRDW